MSATAAFRSLTLLLAGLGSGVQDFFFFFLTYLFESQRPSLCWFMLQTPPATARAGNPGLPQGATGTPSAGTGVGPAWKPGSSASTLDARAQGSGGHNAPLPLEGLGTGIAQDGTGACRPTSSLNSLAQHPHAAWDPPPHPTWALRNSCSPRVVQGGGPVHGSLCQSVNKALFTPTHALAASDGHPCYTKPPMSPSRSFPRNLAKPSARGRGPWEGVQGYLRGFCQVSPAF